MGRYIIPQYLFGGLVVSRLASELAGTHEEFDQRIEDYLQRYPDEDGSALIADLDVAADEARKVVVVLRAADGPCADTAAAIEGLMDVLSKAAELGKPLRRRMVENFFTNAQPIPIPDRVAKAGEHLRAAGNLLAARSAERSEPVR